MSRKKNARRATVPGPGPAAAPGLVMNLYIAESGPNSLQAIANLDAICEAHGRDTYRLEIIDVLQDPQRALAAGIVVTPSLIKVSPLPAVTIVGNLSDRGEVLRALGFGGPT